MECALRKTLVLEGLDCAHCAAKIEEDVKRLDGVADASVNFAAKTLNLQLADCESAAHTLKSAEAVVKRHAPRVAVAEQPLSKTQHKVLLLEGLHCPSCAAKIEQSAGSLPGVASASVDFVSKRLVLEVSGGYDARKIVEQAKKIARDTEPGIRPLEKGEGSAQEHGLPVRRMVFFGISALLFALSLVLQPPFWVGFGMYFASWLIAGYPVVLGAIRNILRGKVFDENFLMTLATVGAFAIREFPEAAAVMLFFNIGEFFQEAAVRRSRKSIASLMDIRPDYANLKIEGGFQKVSPEEVSVGQIILVRPGEKIPLDGTVTEGVSALDTSALTGESLPREVEPGSAVLSGSLNVSGVLSIEVTRLFGESTASKILDLVQNAGAKKAPTENFITRFSRVYTPAVVITALLLAFVPPLLFQADLAVWLNRALVFLVVSCPCALVVSIPLGFFGGIGAASRNGILVKGGNYLEALNQVDTVVFDKTGTLTRGTFRVAKTVPAAGYDEKSLLEYAALAESYSTHPVAVSIVRAYGAIDRDEVTSYSEISGQGVKVRSRGHEILAGNARLIPDVPDGAAGETGTVVHVAVDGKYAGYIVIADEIRADSQQAVWQLKEAGIRRLVMLTGDSAAVAEKVGAELGLTEVRAGLLPGQKVEAVEALEREKPGKGKLLFMGDGINDAPVLARADVGVAMGGLGSDAAIEAADIVLMTDEPSKLVRAIRIARKTRNVVWQNIVFALGVKLIVLVLGAGGIATMWEAVFADVGVALIAVVNAMRVMKSK